MKYTEISQRGQIVVTTDKRYSTIYYSQICSILFLTIMFNILIV